MTDVDWPRIVKMLGAGIASLATFAFGDLNNAWLIFLVILMALDYLSGLIGAWIHDDLSSEVGFKGILKKAMYFFVVAVAHCADEATGAGGVLMNLSIGFLIANEGISILENCANCGIPIPKRLLKALAQIKDSSNDDEENKNTDKDE